MEKDPCLEIGSPEYLKFCRIINAPPLTPLQSIPQIPVEKEIVQKTDFTGFKDTDLLILQRLSDKERTGICMY